MKKIRFLIIFLFFLFFARQVFALSSVVINEIAWMGNEASSANEWIELYNFGDKVISLDGWTISNQKGKLKINLAGEIKPDNFFLLERTDDESVPNIPADQIYKGALANQGEKLILEDRNRETVDLVDCSNKWFAGDKEIGQTMSRISPLVSGNIASNWAESQKPGGTPKEKNDFSKAKPRSELGSTTGDEEIIFVKIAEINKSLIGRLIKTEGRVIEKTGRKIFLADETGKEIVVYLKKGINPVRRLQSTSNLKTTSSEETQSEPSNGVNLKDLKIKEGDFLKAQGLLKAYQDEFRLLISQKEDLEIIKHNDNLEEEVVAINLAGSEGSSAKTKDIKNIFLKSLVVISLILIFLKILSKSSSRQA